MKSLRLARALLLLSILYAALVIGSTAYNYLRVPSDSNGYLLKGNGGCYQTVSLIPYVECSGFTGASVAKFILSMPYILILVVYFAVSSKSLTELAIFVPLTLIFWGPLLYLPFYWWRYARKT